MFSALMQFVFGVTLLVDPARIVDLWPWPMPPLTTRILGASTLVSLPLALLSVGINRYTVAAIPFVMMATYRVLQIAAGLNHLDRFGTNLTSAPVYFGGGFVMLAIFTFGLWAGQTGRLPPAPAEGRFVLPMPWRIAPVSRAFLAILGFGYVALGVYCFARSATAANVWIDARGLTPLTAQLFSSPLIGLGLGMLLVSRASDWRSVAVPAVGMVTIGLVVVIAIALGWADFAPRTKIGWLVASTPLVLFFVGAWILAAKPPHATNLSKSPAVG
jgi:hypothetical protein